ncbi:NAD(P)/FAD-dependent oxidoreductase [Streptomyces sp. NBRC 110028]|uniref:NAD(P)/FAD-dependent oxidoreductase n=1 Tax=Streptomyces sp. NBRC 110028 TaxID=1621260 RepID=UPI00131CA6A4|nr:FAD-dependent monooxygenase [Streptomyces sp. NBRC 110028]
MSVNQLGTEDHPYDVLVVGARCAGAPLGMLLSQRGYAVEMVDQNAAGTDTVSTHWIRWPGVQQLRAWGLVPALEKTGCPPIASASLDFEGRVVTGGPKAGGTEAVTYAPRRTALDALLVAEARAKGARLRERFAVTGLIVVGGRVAGVRGTGPDGPVDLHARVVVGADGRNSTVARLVKAPVLEDRGILARSLYGYWRGAAERGVRVVFRGRRGISLWPTNGDLTVVSLVFPPEEAPAPGRTARDAFYMSSLREVPEVGQALAGADLVSQPRSAAVRNARRHVHGPGWVLAGDAGHHKDPVSAQGISDAFADAAVLADALDAGLSGSLGLDEALAGYSATRDAQRLAAFAYTCQQAELRPFTGEFLDDLTRTAADERAVEAFVNTFVGCDAPSDAGWLGESH